MQSVRNHSLQFYGSGMAVLSAVLYGLMAYFGTMLLKNDFTLANMLFWRFAIATMWMLGTVLISRKRLSPDIKKSVLANIILQAGILYALASALYFLSMTIIGTGLATAIFFSFPVFVAVFTAMFSGTVINRYTVMAVICICLGVLLVKGSHQANVDLEGTLIAVSGAFFYAIYIYRSRFISTLIDAHLLTFLVCLGTMIVFGTYGYFTNQLAMPNGLFDWFCVLAIGILATALPIQFLLESLKYITPIKVSILASLRVVVTILIGWTLLNEQISALQFFGVATILFASMMAQKVN